MRVVLILCLLSLFACSIDILEVGKCLLSKPKVLELALKVFSLISSQDYSNILPSVLNSLPDLFNALTECLSKTETETTLKGGCEHPVRYAACLVENAGMSNLSAYCSRKWC